MTGPEHYKEAERLLNGAQEMADELEADVVPTTEHFVALTTMATLAQAHATLALAAASAENIRNNGAVKAQVTGWAAAIGDPR